MSILNMGRNSVLRKAVGYIQSINFKNDVLAFKLDIPKSIFSERRHFLGKKVTSDWKYSIIRLDTPEGKILSINFIPDSPLLEKKIVIMMEFQSVREEMTYFFPCTKDLYNPRIYKILFFNNLPLSFQEKFKSIPEKNEKGRYLFFTSGSLTKGVR